MMMGNCWIPQKAWIEAADADDKKEARMVLDFLMGLYVIRGEDYRLMNHLVEWNSAVADVTLSFLEDMKHNPQKYYGLEPYPGHPGMYRSPHGYSLLIRIASQTGDKRMLPYFRYFLKNTGQTGGDEWVHREAEMAIQNFDLRSKEIL